MKRKDPCMICSSDAICTEMDTETGKTKQSFIGGYKKEHMVMKWSFYLTICLYRLGEYINPLGRVGALDLHGVRPGTCVM